MKGFPALAAVTILTVTVLVLSGSGSTSGGQQQKLKTKQVLILYSYHESLPWERLIEKILRAAVTSKATFHVKIDNEHANLVTYTDDVYLQKLVDLYRYKYADHTIDLVISVGDEAADILLDYGDKLFPRVPMMFVTTEGLSTQRSFLGLNKTSLEWGFDIKGTVDLIAELLPQTRQIFVVGGSRVTFDRELMKLARTSLQGYTKRFAINYLTDIKVGELLEKVAQLPEHSVLLYLAIFQDAEEKRFIPREMLSLIFEKANVPIFSIADTYLGYGIVGGSLVTAESVGEKCAELALRILQGESTVDLVSEGIPNRVMIDWRLLKRWGISEDKLPPGSIVRFKTYSVWELYRGYIVAAFFLIVVQSGLIAFLLWQRAQRRRAQAQLAERLRFEEMLSALSARFVNLPQERVNAEIKSVLESISKGCELDRVSVFEISEEDQKLHLVHAYIDAKNAAPPSQIQFEWLPWVRQKLLNAETLTFSDPDDLPAEAGEERNFMRAQGVVSLAVIPLSTGEKTLGVLSLAMLRHRKKWPQELMRQCRLVADVLANALERKRQEESLMQAEAKYRTVADFTYDWEYWVNVDDLLEYVSPSCERISGYTPRDFIDDPSLFKKIIVPEDRDVWERHYHDARQELKPRKIQFRIQRQDGEIRWIEHSCQPVTDQQGRLQGFRAGNRDITSRKQAEQGIREREKELRRLTTRLISAHEEERRSLARELHDDLSQRLAALAIQAGRMEQQAENGHALGAEECGRLKDRIIDISTDVHSLSRQLHPSILDDLGLTRAVESECARFANREGVEVAFTAENLPGTIPRDVSLSMYRIIQEGLNNIAKHACARRAKVALHLTDGRLCLSLQDDGIGFDAAKVRQKPGLGLSSMRERVRIIHGVFRLTSEPEKGTTITVRVPLEKSRRTEATPTDSE
jgi:PAS domain S-box-containing protein